MSILKTILLFIALAIITSALTASCQSKSDPSEFTPEELDAKDVYHSGGFSM